MGTVAEDGEWKTYIRYKLQEVGNGLTWCNPEPEGKSPYKNIPVGHREGMQPKMNSNQSSSSSR